LNQTKLTRQKFCRSASHEVGHAVLSMFQQLHRWEVQSIRIIRNGSYISQSSSNISDYSAVNPHHTKWIIHFSILQQYLRL